MDLVMDTCNPSNSGGEGRRITSLRATGLQNEFQASLGYIVRPCLKKPNKQKTKQKQNKTPQTNKKVPALVPCLSLQALQV
jgi:hypothetical protein